jgi:hypothetical protein
MGKLSVIQNKPDRHVASQWPHQDGRRAADKVRPDYLDFLRDTEGVGSLIVADSDGCGVKFDNQKVILNHGDMLFWLPWVRHCGKCFLTWLFAGLTFFRCFLGLPYPKVAVESGSRLFRRLHAYWHLNGRKDLDDIEGIHCREVRTRTHKSTRTQTHTHTRILALSGLSCLGVCRFVLHPAGILELQSRTLQVGSTQKGNVHAEGTSQV